MSDVARVPNWEAALHRERDPLALLLLGVLAILAGILAIVYPIAGGLAVTTIFGVVLIVAAIAHLVHTISAHEGAWNVIGGLIVSVLFAAAGLFLLARPGVGLLFLTVYLGVLYVIIGLFGLAQSLEAIARPGWGYWLVGSIITLVLGIWVLAALPSTYPWFLGLLVGVQLIFFGVRLISLGTIARRLGRTGMAPAT